MKASTLPRYLLGNRAAILEVAASPMAIVCGILFVISAGFAREYDGEDLLHEPWHVLRPLGASLVAGTLLFMVVHGAALLRSRRSELRPPRLGTAYRVFMSLFWMTAPMAWLYAIPYERMMSPVAAIEMNLWTLAFVAAWRVILITRVISVAYGVRTVPAFFLVMLFADVVVFAVATVAPAPVIDFMGGLRHSARDALIADITLSMIMLSVMSAPVWILGALVSLGFMKAKWTGFVATPVPDRSRGLLITALVSIVAWVPVLLATQPEQINRRRAERLLRSGEVAEAFSLISAKQQGDYPPHWNPPPRLGYHEREPSLAVVRDVMRSQPPAEWLAELYLDKMRRQLKLYLLRYARRLDWAEIVERLDEYGKIYEVAADNADSIGFQLEFDTTLSSEDRAALEHLLEAAEHPDLPTEEDAADGRRP